MQNYYVSWIDIKAELAEKRLGRLTKLNAATGGGKGRDQAPHQPMRLPCLLDMGGRGCTGGPDLHGECRAGAAFQILGRIALSERRPTRQDLKLNVFQNRRTEDLIGNEAADFHLNEVWMNSLQN